VVRLHPPGLVGCWIAFGVEDYPYGLLTMIVSLEAIFSLDIRDDQPEPG
jgi:hypothetical protein